MARRRYVTYWSVIPISLLPTGESHRPILLYRRRRLGALCSANMPTADRTDDPTPAKTHRTPAYLLVLLTLVVAAPIVALSQFAAHNRADYADPYLFAYIGRQLLTGAELYVDIWDNKPPGIFWTNALGAWLGSGSYYGVVALTLLAVCLTLGALALTCRRLFRRGTAAVATMLASVYLFHPFYQGGTNRPGTYVALFELLAIAVYVKALTGSRRRFYVCGVFAGLAFVFKQTGLAMLAAAVLHQIYLVPTGKQSTRSAAAVVGRILSGWAAAVGLAVIALGLTGDLGEAWYALFGFPAGYFDTSWLQTIVPDLFGWQEHVDALALPMILGLAALLQPAVTRFFFGKRPADRTTDKRTVPGMMFLLGAYFFCAVYLALFVPHRHMQYFLPVMPPLLLLAARSIDLLLNMLTTPTGRQRIILVIVGLLWCGYISVNPLRHHAEKALMAWHNLANSDAPMAELVGLIRTRTEKDDPIYVFGYHPLVYLRANRPCASRYTSTLNAEQLKAGGQFIIDQIITDLKRTRPKVIVLGGRQYHAMYDRTAHTLHDYGDFGQWLSEHYEPNPLPGHRVYTLKAR